jgi:hypothetical protein
MIPRLKERSSAVWEYRQIVALKAGVWGISTLSNYPGAERGHDELRLTLTTK